MAGGHPLSVETVQPIIYDAPVALESARSAVESWRKILPQLSGVGASSASLQPLLDVMLQQDAAVEQSPIWCSRHVEIYEALQRQLGYNLEKTSQVTLLITSPEQMPWAFAARALFPSEATFTCVWQMPEGHSYSPATLPATFRPALQSLQELMPVVCTGVRPDASTHSVFTLVQTAAALFSPASKDATEPQVPVSNRDNRMSFTPDKLAYPQAVKAFRRLASWALLSTPYFQTVAQRLHITDQAHFKAHSPILRALSEACNLVTQQVNSTDFQFSLPADLLNEWGPHFVEGVKRLSVTASDDERRASLLQALDVLSGSVQAQAEGHLEPAVFDEKQTDFASTPFASPTAWIERTDKAFALYDTDDDEAAQLRRHVMGLWYVFFEENIKNRSCGMEVQEVSLSDLFTAEIRRSLLSLTPMGQMMLQTDVCYDVSSSGRTVAISSPLTGFCINPEVGVFSPEGELHEFGSDFVCFMDAYLRMFPSHFSPSFQAYVKAETALSPKVRSKAEATRPNIIAEFTGFASHVGIDITRPS